MLKRRARLIGARKLAKKQRQKLELCPIWKPVRQRHEDEAQPEVRLLMGLENIIAEALPEVLTTRLDSLINWARRSSLWPATFGLACCAIEMMATSASRYDLARFGAEGFRASPRQADLIIVSGTVTKKMAPQVVRLYNQMPEPKYVIAMGACAISGGPFRDGYNVLKGIDRYIPVDVHIPGCPPRPDAFIHAFMTLPETITAP